MDNIALEDVKFRRGPAATLPTEIVPGTLLIATDTGDVYLDDTSNRRIKLTNTDLDESYLVWGSW